MIVIATAHKVLADELKVELTKRKVQFECVDVEQERELIAKLYRANVVAAILDSNLPSLPRGATTDFLNGLGRRVPVVVIHNEAVFESNKTQVRFAAELSDAVTVVNQPNVHTLIATLNVCGVLGPANPKAWRRAVAYYNPHVSTKMLMENGGLGVLTIDASSFRKIEVEYGSEVYLKVKELFQNLLNEMWGKPGCFRSSDVLCRRSDHGNIYYVFLNRSRTTGSLPLPGVLENISDRLARIIQNALWSELTAPKAQRRLPACIKSMPKVVVGYGSAINNPCLDSHELIATAIDNSAKFASMQHVRSMERYREMITTLIQTPDLLHPHFQAVFRLQGLNQEVIDKSVSEKSIAPLTSFLYGFESLIRVRVEEIRALMGSQRSIVDPVFLRPDILFEIAKQTKVALELDQACLNLALANGGQLPGFLMVNILPRNLYFIGHIKNMLRGRQDLILEVSESETINNFELVHELQRQVRGENIKLAADDFGRAFTGLDRIIEMRPHMIKFDRSLIEDIHIDHAKRAYVNGLVESARMLKTQVLAEGVEKIEELLVLQKMKIDYVQGFLLHRPQQIDLVLEQVQNIHTRNNKVA